MSVFRLAAGEQQVVHRGDAALYLAAAAPELDAAFVAGGVDAVTEAAEEARFAVPAFVAVDWGDGRLRLAVFGAVEVTSDHRSLPSLSAAGSGTWVERTVRTDAIELVVAGTFTLSVQVPGSSTEVRAEVPSALAAVLEPGTSTERADTDEGARNFASNDAPTLDAPDSQWVLRFEDGPVEPVDRALVIGRRPASDDADPIGARLVQIDCPQMSARHLAVRADAAGLWVTDLHSRNRAWVVTSGDHQLVALEPGVPTQLDHGTHVQVGTKVFVVERGD